MSYVTTNAFLATGVTFAILGTAAVGTRFYVRAGKAGLGLDDWFCLTALCFVLGECGIVIAAAVTGVGGAHSRSGQGMKSALYIDDRQSLLEKFETAFDLVQTFTLLFLKLTILFFYRRLFRGKGFNIASWSLIVFSILWAITFFNAVAAACRDNFYINFAALVDLKEKCVDTFTILICLAVFDVVVDLGIIIVPMFQIWSLQMPTRRKFAVSFTLLVGALAISCGITRMAIFAQILGPALLSVASVGGDDSDDIMGVISVLMFWGMLEMGVGIVAVCLPTFRPLFQGMSPESVLRSLRSFITLRSAHSNTTQSAPITEDHSKEAKYPDSQKSLSLPIHDLPPHKLVRGDAYAPRGSVNCTGGHDDASEDSSGVWVNRSVTQSISAV